MLFLISGLKIQRAIRLAAGLAFICICLLPIPHGTMHSTVALFVLFVTKLDLKHRKHSSFRGARRWDKHNKH